MMSAPVPARSTSGIALETTRPSEPSATVNLRGVGATKPSGAEMVETDAGSSTARQVVIRRGRAVVRPRRRTESAPVAAKEAAMVVGCAGRGALCRAASASADKKIHVDAFSGG